MALIVQIETITALDNLEEIACVEGVDAVFFGPGDMAASMGLRGQPAAEPVVERIMDGLARLKNLPAAAGVLAPTSELAERYVMAGFDFVSVTNDAAILFPRCRCNCRPVSGPCRTVGVMSDAAATRIALAGFGAWGQMHARAIADISGAEIGAVLCRSEAAQSKAREMLPQAARYTDYATMLAEADCSVVDITVPNHLHAAFAVAALESDRHVFLEKPIGLDLTSCAAAVEAAHRSGPQGGGQS